MIHRIDLRIKESGTDVGLSRHKNMLDRMGITYLACDTSKRYSSRLRPDFFLVTEIWVFKTIITQENILQRRHTHNNRRMETSATPVGI